MRPIYSDVYPHDSGQVEEQYFGCAGRNGIEEYRFGSKEIYPKAGFDQSLSPFSFSSGEVREQSLENRKNAQPGTVEGNLKGVLPNEHTLRT